MPFIAGQCVNIGIPNTGINREYSTYSGEKEGDLTFLIREVEGGQATSKLRRLNPGDAVEVDGAYGKFVIDQSDADSAKYVCIGTGTGIAPFHSFIRSYPELKFRVIHGIRYIDEAYDREDYPDYTSCTSRDENGDFHGRVTDYLRENPAEKGCYYYLCGNRNMINEVYDILREQGISGSNIITETFF